MMKVYILLVEDGRGEAPPLLQGVSIQDNAIPILASGRDSLEMQLYVQDLHLQSVSYRYVYVGKVVCAYYSSGEDRQC